jgi:hypothetical protein
VGVAGHRDLDPADYPVYREHIARLIRSLRQQYPFTPLRMLSALAEGADRLAVEVALDHGCEIVVPLPLEPAEFERDFPGSAGEFRGLLARVMPENVFVFPAYADTTLSPESRERQYTEAGAYIAAQSHIVLALWDGMPKDSAAGTAAVVRYRLEGRAPSDRSALDAEEGGPVFHIPVRRARARTGASEPPRWLYPHDTDEALCRTTFARIDRFNEDASRAKLIRERAPGSFSRGVSSVACAAASLLPGLESRPNADRILANTFGCADQLARHYQRLTHGAVRLILGLAAVLALTFEVYAEILPRRALPGIYLLIFTSITLLYLWQRRQDAHGRYLDYRALAEGLRVQFYWRLAGIAENASASYLRKQLDELRWIREALRGANTLAPPARSQPDIVFHHWVQGQARYYRARAKLQNHRIHRLERLSSLCVALGLLAALALVVAWNRLEHLGQWHHWIVLVMGFAPIAAALWEAYGERFGLRPQAHQYARFATIFDRAERAIARLEANPAANRRPQGEVALIRELGREALMESGDWVLLLRDRPIVLPKG